MTKRERRLKAELKNWKHIRLIFYTAGLALKLAEGFQGIQLCGCGLNSLVHSYIISLDNRLE
jgi:hypothetical protein